MGLALLLTLAPSLWPRPALAAGPAPRVDGQSVRAGHLRVQVLSPTMLRLEYAADDAFEDRPTFNAVARAPAPPCAPGSRPPPATASCASRPARAPCTTASPAARSPAPTPRSISRS